MTKRLDGDAKMTGPNTVLLLKAGQLLTLEFAATIAAAVFVTGVFLFLAVDFCRQVRKDRRESRQPPPTSPHQTSCTHKQ